MSAIHDNPVRIATRGFRSRLRAMNRFGWLLACCCGVASAHQGGTVSKALFTSPPAPEAAPTDGGLSLLPYTFGTADTQYTVSWNIDLPTDPTGRFDFYYLDH